MAAWGNFVLDKGFDVSGAITKFRAVKLTGVEEVGPVTAIGDDIIGFPQFSVATTEITRGKGASVRVIGVTEAEAGGAIAVNQRCQLAADGTVIALVAASGARGVGKCVGSPSTNAGDRISLLIDVFGALA